MSLWGKGVYAIVLGVALKLALHKTKRLTGGHSMSNTSKQLQDVADYFILKADSEKRIITNKKLQKLVYYAQAWHLVFRQQTLYPDPIEAWLHGPAVRELWRKYKKYWYMGITEKPTPPKFKGRENLLLDEIWRVYGKHDADYLEALTHSEEPWLKARAGLDVDETSSIEISPTVMKQYYSKLNEQKAAI